jgi:hypothetical protein
MKATTWLAGVAACAAAATLSGCADRASPRVEAWRGDGWAELAVRDYRIAGARDGAVTRAVATVALEDGGAIEIELRVFYNPTPVLESGRWTLGAEGGDVSAESIRFLGGQGEGPSLGGRFRLEHDGRPRFRVTLPSRPVESPQRR